MTLDAMNKYFENRGFEVDRIRDSKRDVYIFKIFKDGKCLSGEFTYPKTSDWKERDQQQHKFISSLMRNFYAKGEENNMGNITWRVESFEAHTVDPKSEPILEVSLSGYINNVGGFKSKRGDDIVKDIEEKLNKPNVSYASYRYSYSENSVSPMSISRVIHNDPATIVFWADGTKTVVKCQEGDIYDPEKGLTMAISKKALGNQGNYCNVFKQWCPEEPLNIVACIPFDLLVKDLYRLGIKVDVEFMGKDEPVEEVEVDNRWKIWWEYVNDEGQKVLRGPYKRTYSTKSSAARAARRVFADTSIGWVVSQTNPGVEND